MYRWYQRSAICYVYLVDFEGGQSSDGVSADSNGEWADLTWHADQARTIRLQKCRWFTRGWTLQELIAPDLVVFFDKSWNYLFKKNDTSELLASITGINATVLSGAKNVNSFSIAQRMYWASQRRTTRVEDEAYSLLGLFEINLPLLYGEGQRAFRRLQEAIISASDDTSIFAWELLPDSEVRHRHDLFAPSVANFWNAQHIESNIPGLFLPTLFRDYRLTNQGLHVPFRIHKWRRMQQCDVVLASLNCSYRSWTDSRDLSIGLRVHNPPEADEGSSVYVTYVALS